MRTNLVSHFTVLLKRSSESGYNLMTTERFQPKAADSNSNSTLDMIGYIFPSITV